MTQQRLDETRARCDAATPGPWKAGRGDMATIVDGYESKWIYAGEKSASRYLAIASGYEIEDWDEVMANARFIAASRTDVPDLLDEVSRLTAELAAMTADRDAWKARAEAAEQDLNALRKRSGWKCYACHYDNHSDRDVCVGCGYNDGNNWRWRGPVEGGEGV